MSAEVSANKRRRVQNPSSSSSSSSGSECSSDDDPDPSDHDGSGADPEKPADPETPAAAAGYCGPVGTAGGIISRSQSGLGVPVAQGTSTTRRNLEDELREQYKHEWNVASAADNSASDSSTDDTDTAGVSLMRGCGIPANPTLGRPPYVPEEISPSIARYHLQQEDVETFLRFKFIPQVLLSCVRTTVRHSYHFPGRYARAKLLFFTSHLRFLNTLHDIGAYGGG